MPSAPPKVKQAGLEHQGHGKPGKIRGALPSPQCCPDNAWRDSGARREYADGFHGLVADQQDDDKRHSYGNPMETTVLMMLNDCSLLIPWPLLICFLAMPFSPSM